MKKKILAIITSLFMILSFTGCNTQGLSLSKELQKVTAWEAMSESGDINVTVKAGGEEIKLAATYDAFTNQKDLQMEMTILPQSMEMSGSKLDLTQGQYKFSPVKVYMNGFKFYISTSYITDLCRFAGVNAADMMDVSKEYVALDLTDMMKASGTDINKIMEEADSSYEMYEKMNIEIPINKNGREYTISLTSDQMVDALFGLVNETFATQEATLRATYKAMGLSDEEIDEVLAQVKAVYNDETKEQVKPVIKGSTAKVVYDFSDDKYTTDIDCNLKLSVGSEVVELSMTVNDTVKKADKKVIAFPTNVKTYTMEDIENLIMSEIAAENTVEVAKAQTFTENGKVYVPVKSTLASIGLEVQYDADSKTVAIKGTNVIVPVVLKGGTSYTTVEFLQTMGINCEIVG